MKLFPPTLEQDFIRQTYSATLAWYIYKSKEQTKAFYKELETQDRRINHGKLDIWSTENHKPVQQPDSPNIPFFS